MSNELFYPKGRTVTTTVRTAAVETSSQRFARAIEALQKAEDTMTVKVQLMVMSASEDAIATYHGSAKMIADIKAALVAAGAGDMAQELITTRDDQLKNLFWRICRKIAAMCKAALVAA